MCGSSTLPMDRSWPSFRFARAGVTQLLSDLPVQVNGVPEGFTASVEPDRLGVVVFASEETMANLSGEEISASVSAEGLGAGRHQVRPSVTVPPEVQWLRTDPEVVVVTIEPEATAVPADTSGPARHARGDAGGVMRSRNG